MCLVCSVLLCVLLGSYDQVKPWSYIEREHRGTRGINRDDCKPLRIILSLSLLLPLSPWHNKTPLPIRLGKGVYCCCPAVYAFTLCEHPTLRSAAVRAVPDLLALPCVLYGLHSPCTTYRPYIDALPGLDLRPGQSLFLLFASIVFF